MVGADHSNRIACHRRDRTGLVRHGDVEHLLALAGVADAILFLDDKALPFAARDQELALALVDEQRHDRGVLLHVDEHADRFAMAAAARQLCDVERVELSVGGKQQQL
jgi:hypothetical protein